jgi:hypothetical protein
VDRRIGWINGSIGEVRGVRVMPLQASSDGFLRLLVPEVLADILAAFG